MQQLRAIVLLSCYKRPEYTEKCIQALEVAQEYHDIEFYMVDDGSGDSTSILLHNSSLPGTIVSRDMNVGLRDNVIDFYRHASDYQVNYLCKMDNDCMVPIGWLNDLISIMDNNQELDIISPNVYPSNIAHKISRKEAGLGYRPAKTVGGLWCMRSELVEGMEFNKYNVQGIKGAWSLTDQIITENDPTVGWTTEVTVSDVGHWSGKHPDHIKTGDHSLYYKEVGRKTTW